MKIKARQSLYINCEDLESFTDWNEVCKMSLTIDVRAKLGRLHKIQGGACVNWELLNTQTRNMEEIGLKLTRVDMSLDRMVTKGQDGKLKINFERSDRMLEGLTAMGLQPIVILSYMPECMSVDPEKYLKVGAKQTSDLEHAGAQIRNILPPADYSEWEELIYKVVRRYNVEKGLGSFIRWELWNEPDVPGFWAGEWQDFIRLYEATARGALRADSNVRIGGPAVAYVSWCKSQVEDFLSYCSAHSIPIDFLTWHDYCRTWKYFETPDIHFRHIMMVEIASMRTLAAKYGYRPELIIDEWNYAVPCVTENDSLHNAIYCAEFLHIIQEEGLDQTVCQFIDPLPSSVPPIWLMPEQQGLEDQKISAYGMCGLITHDGVLKPAYNVFKMHNMLAEAKVEASTFDLPFEIVAAIDEKDERFTLLMWSKQPSKVETNYEQLLTLKVPPMKSNSNVNFDLKVIGLPSEKKVRVRHYLIDETHSNGYNDKKRQTLECVDERFVQSTDEFKMRVELPFWSVSLLEIDWKSRA